MARTALEKQYVDLVSRLRAAVLTNHAQDVERAAVREIGATLEQMGGMN